MVEKIPKKLSEHAHLLGISERVAMSNTNLLLLLLSSIEVVVVVVYLLPFSAVGILIRVHRRC